MKLKRNSAKCRWCGIEIVSTHRHDFVGHTCEKAGKIGKTYNHDSKSYVPTFPFFAIDGGLYYAKRVGEPINYIDTSEWREEPCKCTNETGCQNEKDAICRRA